MKYLGQAALVLSFVLLCAHLFYLDEAVLTFTTLFPPLLMALATTTMKGRHQKKGQENKGRIVLAGLILILLLPFGFHQREVVGESSWKEVGILLNGPYSVFLIFLSVPMVLGIIVASRMQRGEDDSR